MIRLINVLITIGLSSILLTCVSCSAEERAEMVAKECNGKVAERFRLCVKFVGKAKIEDVDAEISACEAKWRAAQRSCCEPIGCE